MNVNGISVYNIDPTIKKESMATDGGASSHKTMKQMQEDVKKQVAIEKVEKKEQKKIEDTRESEEIKQELNELVAKLNKEMSPINQDVKFGYNEDLGQLMVNVVDAKTGDVIRQIPSEEAIKIMTKMKELAGMLFDKKG